MTAFARRFLAAPSLYPVTACYVCAVLTIIAISAGWVRIDTGILLLGFAAVLIVAFRIMFDFRGVQKEVSTIHELANSQHDAAMARIDQLTAALIANSVRVPDDPQNPATEHAKAR